ncbi:YciE/YciF ferroxidase family protein [Schlesneria paludicola]|uniref:YciE/YciF ferroxidase family protein n=1 Tax=Schlesneria paludicola TaxID=360056 RepID=UPI00029B239A|nr:ferritin-like domain-containing protein [Schlesneria paludicola]
MHISNLNELFVNELRDILSAENQLVKALPKMAKGATSEELRTGFENHLEQTKTHVLRLHQIFEALGLTARAKTCEAMKGLVKEGSEILEMDCECDVKDAALIAAAQKVEHYEIATYGTLITWAQLMHNTEAASLLSQTLAEEKETDGQLTELAESSINAAAV